ncbi:ABC transporter substrate-binding protein [Humibacter ginsenosidimutans]|nr:ABC transporter substrate-binding protein [Humibacter ginsenosidimutans]
MPSRTPNRRLPRLLGAAALAASLVLTGCSAQKSVADPAASGSASTPSTVVKTLYGDVTVPAHPKRVAALDFPEATALADLGIKPVAIGSYTPDLDYYTSFLKGVPIATDDSGVPIVEKVAAAKPDLIILDSFTDQLAKNRPIYEKLSAIAPTVVLKWTEAAGSWQEDAAGTARAVGKTAQLDKLKAQFEARAASIKKKYADVLATKTIDLISGDESTWFLYGPTSSHGRVLAEAGARFGAAADQKDGFVQYSPERYDLLKDTGIVIVDAATDAEAAKVTGSPVFGTISAARDHDVFRTPYFFPSSYRIANALLDDFANALKNAQ